MIIPMINYQFLLYYRDLEDFLEQLRGYGVVDLQQGALTGDPANQALFQRVSRIQHLLDTLKKLQKSAPQGTSETAVPEPQMDADALFDAYEQLVQEREQLLLKTDQLAKELRENRIWGDFDPAVYDQVRQAGYRMRFFSIYSAKFNPEWTIDVPLHVIGEAEGRTFFVMLFPVAGQQETLQAASAPETEAPVTLQHIAELAQEHKAPRTALSTIQAEWQHCRTRLQEMAAREQALVAYRAQFEALRDRLLNDMEFDSARQQACYQAEDRLVSLEGYVPENRNDAFTVWLESQPVVYTARPVKRNENAPILLKNNRFAKYFEAVGALNSLPVYGEIDLTPFLAPFFWMFYGFCLGDGGYGILLFVVGALLKRKMDEQTRPLMTLVQFFGVSTLIFGILTGNFFGIALGDLAVFAGVKDRFLDSDFLFALSLIVGLVQIVFGMTIKVCNIVRQHGWGPAVSPMAWLWLIVSTIGCYLLGEKAGLPACGLGSVPHIICMGIAAIGIFFFNSPGKNPLINIGTGIWDTYNMATGLVGDLLSYIRLFVLSLSGSILGSVFNTLAFGLSPDIPVIGFLVTLLILLFGHFINIFMNGLGAFVHTVRLTFLEFYKATGYTGGGRAYHPFKTIKSNQ